MWRLCFSTLGCPHWTLPQVVGAAGAHGIHGIEVRGLGTSIDITHDLRFAAEIDNTIGFLKQHQLQIACFDTSVTLVCTADRWETGLDEFSRYAAIAQRFSTRYIRVFGGSLPQGLSRPEAAVMAQRHLRQLHRIAAAYNCQPLVETHDDWANSQHLMSAVSAFTPDEVGVLWDVEHPFRGGEKPRSTAETLATHLKHVHLKDSRRIDNKNIPTLLGEGELPLGNILGALESIHYEGWISLETELRWHPQTAPAPELAIPHFVKFMQNPPAPTPGVD